LAKLLLVNTLATSVRAKTNIFIGILFGFVILTPQNYLVKKALSRARLLKGF